MTGPLLERRDVPPSGRDILLLAQIVDLVRSGAANTRPELEAATGLGRTVVNERLREGVELGVLEEAGTAQADRGRPSRTVRFRGEAGLVLSASLGAVSMFVSVSDLEGTTLARAEEDIDVADGPETVLQAVHERFQTLLRRAAKGRAVWAIGVGLPGPVDFATGRVVAPPIMPGWDGFDVRAWFRSRYEAPVWVDNDVNLMALGEWSRGEPREYRDLLYIKAGTGIGSGLVTNGRLHRGDSGAAGDIGHVQVSDDPDARCRCGNIGCLEAVASAWALGRRLTAVAERGDSPALAENLREHGRITGIDIGRATTAGDPIVIAAVREAAHLVGRTVAGVVNFANPGVLVLGGGAIRGNSVFFDEFKAAVLAGTIELAARRLVIRPSSLDFAEGPIGGALLAAQRLLRPQAMQLWLAAGTPIGSAVRIQDVA